MSALQDLADEEERHANYVAMNTNATQDLADMEAQLKAELDAVNAQLTESVDNLTTEAEAKQKNAEATRELAQATSWLYDAQGNLKDTSSGSNGSEYSVYTPSNNSSYSDLMAMHNETVQTSTVAMSSFNNSLSDVETTVEDFNDELMSVVDDLSSALSSISGSLGIDYASSARQSLFGGTSNALSFSQAQANAKEAWAIFQSDTFNEEYLATYNDKMNELIGTLQEFENASNYNSSAEQEFAKHLALRQVEGFQDAQLDQKTETDAQLAYLEGIEKAVKGTDLSTSKMEEYELAIKNGTFDIKSLTGTGNNELVEIDNSTKKDANTTSQDWGVTKEIAQYNKVWFPDAQGGIHSENHFAGVTRQYGMHDIGGKIKGYQSGGYTGNYAENQVVGQVHGKEFVVTAAATDALGLNDTAGGVFQQMNAKLSHLYEINKTTKKSLNAERQILANQEGVA